MVAAEVRPEEHRGRLELNAARGREDVVSRVELRDGAEPGVARVKLGTRNVGGQPSEIELRVPASMKRKGAPRKRSVRATRRRSYWYNVQPSRLK